MRRVIQKFDKDLIHPNSLISGENNNHSPEKTFLTPAQTSLSLSPLSQTHFQDKQTEVIPRHGIPQTEGSHIERPFSSLQMFQLITCIFLSTWVGFLQKKNNNSAIKNSIDGSKYRMKKENSLPTKFHVRTI